MKNLAKFGVKVLDSNEVKQTQGGVLIGAFAAGFWYGFIKEKFESGQWEI